MEVLQIFTPSTRRITFVNLNKFVQNLLSTFCANYLNPKPQCMNRNILKYMLWFLFHMF